MDNHLYAIVVCESSGDNLAEGLVREIKKQDPQATFIGIFGPKIRAVAGSNQQQLFDMEDLSVMGICEVLLALPRILRIRKQLVESLIAAKPVVYIGVDAPDFNLTVEAMLKQSGIPTIHYVSPSVWAWRTKRIFKIKEATNMVLSILPFEKKFYDKFDTPCTYVGHRLARVIPLDYPISAARYTLRFSEDAMKNNQVVGVFPGSRVSEIKFLTPEFAESAYYLQKIFPVMRFICAATTNEKAQLISKLWRKHAPSIPLTIWVGRSHDVMAASNALMIASGTATLEAMLLKKRMVVCYIVNQVTAIIGRKLMKVKMYSLPNLLAGKKIVPELIQEDCTPEKIVCEIEKIFTSNDRHQLLEFIKMHKELSIDSDKIAVDTIFKVLKDFYKK
ncbi:MAG: lipid-A-disaccharide synthase [Succinivibrionaceae bacterium]